MMLLSLKKTQNQSLYQWLDIPQERTKK